MNHSTNMRIPTLGLGNRLTEMVIWCRENVTAGEWAQHHHSEHRKDEASTAYARFYFATETDAEAFRKRWPAPPAS